MQLTIDTFHPCKNTKQKIISNDKLYVEISPAGGNIELDIQNYDEYIWSHYHFLVADIYHECEDVLVIILKFKQDKMFISVHNGILPYVKTRLCFPLKALNGEKLFLDRYPGSLQCVLRGDSSIDRSKIDGFSIETIPSLKGRKFEVSNIQLREDEPEFLYDRKPYIDEMGQLAIRNWQSKTSSLKELEEYLHNELNHQKENDKQVSSFGGWKELQFRKTGYFRTEFDGEKWWLVDPDGYAMFSTGIDCIQPYDTMKVSGMEQLISWLPDKKGKYEAAWTNYGFSYAVANIIRAYGNSWWEKWAELTKNRLKEWKINTIANWSQQEFIQFSQIPYVYPLNDFPTTEMKIYRDFPDVFSDEYDVKAKCFAQQLQPLKEDPLLIGYFLRNEPHWAFVDSLNLTGLMMEQSYPFESKKIFIQWLKKKYETIMNLNESWGSSFSGFEHIVDEYQYEQVVSENREKDFASFNRILIRRYVELPSNYCKEVDPNHLNLGMRYAWIANDDLLEGCEVIDVFSINSYTLKPDTEQIEHISKKLNMPVMIGEFHFGAADVGLLAYGIRAVATQADRGMAYRYYVEQAASIPSLVGIHYFQYNDQAVLGRFDGENYQIGFVDVCQRPYEEFIEQVKMAHDRIYSIRTGVEKALPTPPVEIPKTGF
ncbi:hypothetical protein WQ54_10885 [Bacillus sp. SA1-12]|uniref:beta-galactosidase n=1 Tax=Bacillus sp. SA1-12 TaxID=1455638 RepID=UPI000625AECC|nr:beta-galactosidase [Bacillus sp. SA1-12]KKI92187.1 hypothetical protein WQ54_10885 [Bacillus sp. SA1-12]